MHSDASIHGLSLAAQRRRSLDSAASLVSRCGRSLPFTRMSLARLLLTCALLVSPGCSSASKMLAPSNYRNWEADQAVLPYVEFRGNQFVAHNVRYCRYLDQDSYVVEHEDRTYDMSQLRGVDFFMVPFDN